MEVNLFLLYQDLEEKIGQKCAVLWELRDKICGKREKSRCDYISQTDESIQACAALTDHVSNEKCLSLMS